MEKEDAKAGTRSIWSCSAVFWNARLFMSGIQPVSRAAFIRKPAVNGQHHFICRRSIVECLIFITQPQELLLAVTFADIDAELNERVIYGAVHRIRLIHVAGTFDGDRPLVIGIAGRTPAAVLFLDTK